MKISPVPRLQKEFLLPKQKKFDNQKKDKKEKESSLFTEVYKGRINLTI